MVAKHLTKLFDSMAKLKMKEVEEKATNTATIMIAKDGETVPFVEECVCEGQVCLWTTANKQEMRAGRGSMRVIADTGDLQQQNPQSPTEPFYTRKLKLYTHVEGGCVFAAYYIVFGKDLLLNGL